MPTPDKTIAQTQKKPPPFREAAKFEQRKRRQRNAAARNRIGNYTGVGGVGVAAAAGAVAALTAAAADAVVAAIFATCNAA